MGNNQEIRQRMNTYRSILLALNWIGAVVIFIVGIVLANSRYTQGIGIGVIIGSVIIGVVGHFLINVALAIPFILLNNGDYLAAIVLEGRIAKSAVSSVGILSDDKSSAEDISANKIPVKYSGKEYVVLTPTKIFYERNINSNGMIDLNVGDKVFQQYDIKEGQIVWYFVKGFNTEGWCKAEYLKEC